MLVGDRYRLEELIGRGGMGEVWRAADELLGRTVAVKLLAAEADHATAQRFSREAEIAARLNHPHVVALYDAGSHQSRPYLVMEYVEGRSLAEELSVHGGLAPERVADLAAQIAEGLSAAHQQGVVHRDIKPSNLLLSADGAVKIADFGIARIVDEAEVSLTATGQLMGTSTYLAPERALGRPAGPASDVYALGCVLYELLTGHPPFRGDTAAAVVHQHVAATPARPGRLRSGLPGSLEDYLLRLLAKEPGHRPTAERVRDWFAAWRDSRTAPSPAPDAAMSTAQPSRAAVASPARPARSRTTVTLGIAGAVLFCVSFLVGTSLIDEASAPPGRARPSQSPTEPATSEVMEPSVRERTTTAAPDSARAEPSATPTHQRTAAPTPQRTTPPIPTASPPTTDGSPPPSTTPPPKPGRSKGGKPRPKG